MKPNLQNVSLKITAGLAKQFPRDGLAQIAFSGRSNVGKSSLINTLLGRKKLARVSASPGKTITINFYDVDKQFYLVDLPGYGFAKRAPQDKAQWSALVDGYFTDYTKEAAVRLCAVAQLIDLKVGPTADDEMMLQFLTQSQIPYFVVATKVDKLNKTERLKAMDLLQSHPLLTAAKKILPFSAQSGEGKAEVLQIVFDCIKAD